MRGGHNGKGGKREQRTWVQAKKSRHENRLGNNGEISQKNGGRKTKWENSAMAKRVTREKTPGPWGRKKRKENGGTKELKGKRQYLHGGGVAGNKNGNPINLKMTEGDRTKLCKGHILKKSGRKTLFGDVWQGCAEMGGRKTKTWNEKNRARVLHDRGEENRGTGTQRHERLEGVGVKNSRVQGA